MADFQFMSDNIPSDLPDLSSVTPILHIPLHAPHKGFARILEIPNTINFIICLLYHFEIGLILKWS